MVRYERVLRDTISTITISSATHCGVVMPFSDPELERAIDAPQRARAR